MKRSRLTTEQMISAIKRQEAGENVAKLCRELGIAGATFYKWKAKYGGMNVDEAKRLKAMEDENRRRSGGAKSQSEHVTARLLAAAQSSAYPGNLSPCDFIEIFHKHAIGNFLGNLSAKLAL